ncbi:MAG TPA: hypothetical protein VIR03_03550 [Candidatus Saccharimonadales bacterium]
MHIKTIESTQVWQSPDGQKTIWEVILQAADNKEYRLKTFSPRIAEVGFEGEVESYVNNRGDRFVRQTAKERQTGDANREVSIRAQWAIGQAIALASATMDRQKINMKVIEKYAKDLFATVSRVKGEEVSPEEMQQAAKFISQHARA